MTTPASLRPASGRTPLALFLLAGGIVAAIALATLFATGVWSFSPSGGANSGGGVTYRQAVSIAGQKPHLSPGAWSLVFASALDTPIALANISLVVYGPGGTTCVLSARFPPYLSGPFTTTIPSFHGNSSSGVSPFWTIVYFNTTGVLAFLPVINGVSDIIEESGFIPCPSLLTGSGGIPANAIDSGPAAATAGQAGGDAFLRQFPNATVQFQLLGPVSLGIGGPQPSTWSFTYSLCPAPGAALPRLPPPEPTLNITLNATSGKVLSDRESTVPCPSHSSYGCPPICTTPIGSVLGVTTPSESVLLQNRWYNFSVAFATNGVVWDDLNLAVENSTGFVTPPGSGWTLNALNASGTIVATYYFLSSTWLTGGSGAVATGDVLSLNAPGMTLSGESLVIAGANGYSGTLITGIP